MQITGKRNIPGHLQCKCLSCCMLIMTIDRGHGLQQWPVGREPGGDRQIKQAIGSLEHLLSNEVQLPHMTHAHGNGCILLAAPHHILDDLCSEAGVRSRTVNCTEAPISI